MRNFNSIFFILFLVIPFSISSQTNSFQQELRRNAWKLEQIDTARNMSAMNEVEKDTVLALNAVRVAPKRFADIFVKRELSYYTEDKLLRRPNALPIRTREGLAPAQELFDELSRSAAVQVLVPYKGLNKAARAHALDQSKTGATGHTGSDKSDPFTRIERFGTWKVPNASGVMTVGENIAYGSNTGLQIVLDLLVDDGVSDRGHRKNILKKDFGVVGIGFAPHKTIRYVTVMNFAAAYQDN